MEKHEELVKLIVKEVRKVLEKRMPSAGEPEESVPAVGAESLDDSVFRIDQKVLTLNALTGIESTVKRIVVPKNIVITPLANEYLNKAGIELVRAEGDIQKKKGVRIGLVSSKRDSQALRDIKRILDTKKIPWQDYNTEATVDDAFRVNLGRMMEGILKKNICLGICIDDTGVEAPLLANRTEGIRAVCCPDTETAKIARKDFDANILVFPGRVFTPETAEEVLSVWLD